MKVEFEIELVMMCQVDAWKAQGCKAFYHQSLVPTVLIFSHLQMKWFILMEKP